MTFCIPTTLTPVSMEKRLPRPRPLGSDRDACGFHTTTPLLQKRMTSMSVSIGCSTSPMRTEICSEHRPLRWVLPLPLSMQLEKLLELQVFWLKLGLWSSWRTERSASSPQQQSPEVLLLGLSTCSPTNKQVSPSDLHGPSIHRFCRSSYRVRESTLLVINLSSLECAV